MFKATDDFLHGGPSDGMLAYQNMLARVGQQPPASQENESGQSSQLHYALMYEHWQRCRLAHELDEALASLASLRSELVRSQATIKRSCHVALHHNLTALPDTTVFKDKLDGLIHLSDQMPIDIAVLYVALDGFESVRETHGSGALTELLSVMAARLMRTIRADDVIGRIGQESFACLLINASGHNQLARVASKIFDAVSDPVQLGDVRLNVQPNIGISVYPQCGNSSSSLLSCAEASMLQARSQQSGYAFYSLT